MHELQGRTPCSPRLWEKSKLWNMVTLCNGVQVREGARVPHSHPRVSSFLSLLKSNFQSLLATQNVKRSRHPWFQELGRETEIPEYTHRDAVTITSGQTGERLGQSTMIECYIFILPSNPCLWPQSHFIPFLSFDFSRVTSETRYHVKYILAPFTLMPIFFGKYLNCISMSTI